MFTSSQRSWLQPQDFLTSHKRMLFSGWSQHSTSGKVPTRALRSFSRWCQLSLPSSTRLPCVFCPFYSLPAWQGITLPLLFPSEPFLADKSTSPALPDHTLHTRLLPHSITLSVCSSCFYFLGECSF